MKKEPETAEEAVAELVKSFKELFIEPIYQGMTPYMERLNTWLNGRVKK